MRQIKSLIKGDVCIDHGNLKAHIMENWSQKRKVNRQQDISQGWFSSHDIKLLKLGAQYKVY